MKRVTVPSEMQALSMHTLHCMQQQQHDLEHAQWHGHQKRYRPCNSYTVEHDALSTQAQGSM
jgi:hypothetical protein